MRTLGNLKPEDFSRHIQRPGLMMGMQIPARDHVRDLDHGLHARRKCGPHTEIAIVQRHTFGRIERQTPRGLDINIGSRLPTLDLIQTDDKVDTAEKTGLFKLPLSAGRDTVGRDSARQAVPVERIEKIVDTRPQRNTLQHSRIERTVPGRIENGRVDLRVQFLIDEPGILRLGDSDKAHEEERLQLVSEAAENRWPDFELKSLGIEQQAIQIKDDTGETNGHFALQESISLV